MSKQRPPAVGRAVGDRISERETCTKSGGSQPLRGRAGTCASETSVRTAIDSLLESYMTGRSNVAAVLATDLEEGIADLSERTVADGLHEGLEDVLAVDGRRLEPLQRLWGVI